MQKETASILDIKLGAALKCLTLSPLRECDYKREDNFTN